MTEALVFVATVDDISYQITCRVALVGGKLLASPTVKQAAASDLDLLYVGLEDEPVMVEMQASRFPDTTIGCHCEWLQANQPFAHLSATSELPFSRL